MPANKSAYFDNVFQANLVLPVPWDSLEMQGHRVLLEVPDSGVSRALSDQPDNLELGAYQVKQVYEEALDLRVKLVHKDQEEM